MLFVGGKVKHYFAIPFSAQLYQHESVKSDEIEANSQTSLQRCSQWLVFMWSSHRLCNGVYLFDVVVSLQIILYASRFLCSISYI